MRCSVSPCLRASCVCMLMQKAQPLICDARVLTSSISDCSRPEPWIWASSALSALMVSGAAWKKFIRGFMVILLFEGVIPKLLHDLINRHQRAMPRFGAVGDAVIDEILLEIRVRVACSRSDTDCNRGCRHQG